MTGTRAPLTTRVDADAIVEALTEHLEDPVHVVVLYDIDDFEIVHVSDFARSLYQDDEQMREHFTQFHEYVNLDFMERDLFEDTLAREAGEVRANTTHMDAMTLLRVFDDDTGIFVTTQPEANVTAAVSIVEEAIA